MYMGKQTTLDFAEVLTRDLTELGHEVDEADRIVQWSRTDGRTDTLWFRKRNASGNVQNVKYISTIADTVYTEVDDNPTLLYEVQRVVNDTLTGSSPATLQGFSIDLLDDDGASVGAALEETRQIRIGLINTLPFAGDRVRTSDGTQLIAPYLRATYWSTTLRPTSLRN